MATHPAAQTAAAAPVASSHVVVGSPVVEQQQQQQQGQQQQGQGPPPMGMAFNAGPSVQDSAGMSALWPSCRNYLHNLPLGRECRSLFNLDPNLVFLNHNAYGTAVKAGTADVVTVLAFLT